MNSPDKPHSIVSFKRPPSPRLAEAGFTLIEMLVVVVLLGILTSTLAVSLSGRHDEHAIRVTAEDLAAAIQFAAQRARTTGRPYRVAFLGGMTGYRIEQTQTAGGTDFEPVGGLAGQKRQLMTGVRVASVDRGPEGGQGSTSGLEYDGAGGGFCGSIRLINRTGQNITIQVLPYTGQVYVAN